MGVGSLALVTVLTGCGSSVTGSASEASGSASSGSSSASSSSSAGSAPTAAALQAAVVQAGELPAGWTGQPYEDDSGDAGQAALLACLGVRDTTPDQIDDEHSPDFSTTEGSSISSSATSYRSQQDVDDDVAALTEPSASGCFADQLSSLVNSGGLPEGATVGDAQISVEPGSNGGPSNVVATGNGSIPVTVDGQQITFYFGVAFMTGRMTEAEVDFFGVGAPVPADLQSSLVDAVGTRVGAL